MQGHAWPLTHTFYATLAAQHLRGLFHSIYKRQAWPDDLLLNLTEYISYLIIGIQKISLFLVLSSLCGSDVRTGFQPHSPTHTVTSNLTIGNPCIIESYREVGRTIYTSQEGAQWCRPSSHSWLLCILGKNEHPLTLSTFLNHYHNLRSFTYIQTGKSKSKANKWNYFDLMSGFGFSNKNHI